MLSSPVLGQVPPVSERLVYELTNSILDELWPQAQTWYKRGADGKYQWQRPMPGDTPAVRLLLQDRQGLGWCKGLLCPYSSDSVQYEQQLLRHFSAADLAYMRQQLPAATRFIFRQARIRQPWVHVVPVDTISALSRRRGVRARIVLGDSVLQRFGERKTYHISQMVFTKDQRRALVTVGDDLNGYTVTIYYKTGANWEQEQDVLMVEY